MFRQGYFGNYLKGIAILLLIVQTCRKACCSWMRQVLELDVPALVQIRETYCFPIPVGTHLLQRYLPNGYSIHQMRCYCNIDHLHCLFI